MWDSSGQHLMRGRHSFYGSEIGALGVWKTWWQGGHNKVVITTGDHNKVIRTNFYNNGSKQNGYYNFLKQRHGCGIVEY